MLREAKEEKFCFPNPKEEKTIIFLEWCVREDRAGERLAQAFIDPDFFYFGLKHRHEALPSPFSPLALLRKAAGERAKPFDCFTSSCSVGFASSLRTFISNIEIHFSLLLRRFSISTPVSSEVRVTQREAIKK